METLFSAFSLSEIALFTMLLASLIVGGLRFYDEISKRVSWWADRKTRQAQKEIDLSKRLDEIEQRQIESDRLMSQFVTSLKSFSDSLEILVDSDKDSIKAYLTDKHHYYCYTQGWVDDYNLDCIERRYVHYKKAGGNSFVDHLMEELRLLPTQPPKE
jgi:hypothetical protein